MNSITHILGIDISKEKFDVHLRLLVASEQHQVATFTNQTKGFKALRRWLEQHGLAHEGCLHACMESTSRYGDALASFLYEEGFLVSMVNPRRTRHYADSQLTRTVNDTVDARIIADFCASQRHKLAQWEPLSPAHRQLRDLTRARQALVEDRDRFANMLETAAGLARKTFLKQVRQLERQIKDMERAIKQFLPLTEEFQKQVELAESVPGVGLITAATVLAELPPIKKLSQANKAVALFGLDTIQKTSGTSVKTRARLSRMGSRRGRRALYMPALTAMRFNPVIKKLVERLRAKGHKGNYLVVAAMRKLLRLIYGVVKQGKPFDPHWSNPRAHRAQLQEA
jgi:transposase